MSSTLASSLPVSPSNSLELSSRLGATTSAGTLQASSSSHPIRHPLQPHVIVEIGQPEPQPSDIDTSNQIQERSKLPKEVDTAILSHASQPQSPSGVDAALSSNPDRVAETEPQALAQGVDAAPTPQCHDPSREPRIVNHTSQAILWSNRTFGANNGLHEYMKQLHESDVIFPYCEELRRLCDANDRMADVNDLGSHERFDTVKLALKDRMGDDWTGFSMAPLTFMWFCVFVVAILSSFLLSALGPSKDSTTGKPCTSISHFVVGSIYILMLLTVGLYTKRWLMQREAASTGPRSHEVANVTYWSVLDLQQTKIGGGVLTTLYVAAFGVTWFKQCSGV